MHFMLKKLLMALCLLCPFNQQASSSERFDWEHAKSIHRDFWENHGDRIFPVNHKKLYEDLSQTVLSIVNNFGLNCQEDPVCLKETYLNQQAYIPGVGRGIITAILKGGFLNYEYEIPLPLKTSRGRTNQRYSYALQLYPYRLALPIERCQGKKCIGEDNLFYHFNYGLGKIVAINPYRKEMLFYLYSSKRYRYVQMIDIVPTKYGCLKEEDFCVGQYIPYDNSGDNVGYITNINIRTNSMHITFQDKSGSLDLKPEHLPNAPLDYYELCEDLSRLGANCSASDLSELARETWVRNNRNDYNED